MLIGRVVHARHGWERVRLAGICEFLEGALAKVDLNLECVRILRKGFACLHGLASDASNGAAASECMAFVVVAQGLPFRPHSRENYSRLGIDRLCPVTARVLFRVSLSSVNSHLLASLASNQNLFSTTAYDAQNGGASPSFSSSI